MRLRVFAFIDQDRPIGPSVVWKIAHRRAPFCTLHCLMCCEEKLMGFLQRKVVEEGGEASVDAFNNRMKALGVGFHIQRRKREDSYGAKIQRSSTQAYYKPVKLNGNTAMKCVTVGELLVDEAFKAAKVPAGRYEDTLHAWMEIFEAW
eukprot:1639547-Rhodomonas_salina.1